MNVEPAMNAEQTSPHRALPLDGEMTIYRAAELRASIASAIEGAAALTLDLSEVTEIDSAGAQLLIAARRTARETGCALTIAGCGDEVMDALGVLGLAAELGASAGRPASVTVAETAGEE
jgi:anti-anti-sigma factor